MAKLWLVFLMTCNSGGFALGHVQAFDFKRQCIQVADMHNAAPNTLPARCEQIREDVVQIVMDTFPTSRWACDGKEAWIRMAAARMAAQ